MRKHLRLIHLRSGYTETERQELLLRLRRDLPPQATVQATLPGTYNGGDLLLRGAVDPLPDDGAIVRIDSAAYEDGESGGDWSGGGIYRVLLLSLKPGTGAAQVVQFEREVLAMPRYIRAIRGWRLGRVTQAHGARPWTHVWEQCYDSPDGLQGPYMLHPYHWAWVDRWFDPESPHWIVDTHLCHSFCNLA